MATVEIDVTQGQIAPRPIAIPVFLTDEANRSLGQEMTAVITGDLERSGLFNALSAASFLEQVPDVDTVPRFEAWRPIGAQMLVVGRVVADEGERIRTEFRLWDVVSGEQLAGEQFFTSRDNWRRLAHIVADAIYERLVGETGYFDSRIVFVEESGPKERRVKRLAIMDQDGAGRRYLTDGRDLVLAPQFSPSHQELTYISFSGDHPQVYLLDIESGEQEMVGNFPGMTYAPRFSPDGQKVIMSLQQGGNANIFVMDLRSRQTERLTHGPSIDTSPSYAPSGEYFVFESDRGGSQQLYIARANGTEARRISFGPGRYSTPVWSPRGDLIAFTKMHGGRFMIGVIRPDGSGERILTEGYHNEGPSWAPNGRVLVFFRETPGEQGGAKLWTVDQTGYNERLLDTLGFASDPSWSPLRK